MINRKAGELVSCQVKGVGFKMAYCPAGEFWMGSEEGVGYKSERPRHCVKISKPFLMGQTQVTQALWQAVMNENPSKFYFMGRNWPVEQVSWFDMVRFCNRLSELENFRPVYDIGSGDKPTVNLDFSANGYRLPTEAEWEYAAKAGTELLYAGSEYIDEVGWYCSNSSNTTHEVATKKPNAWGLYDMSGNVLEWCNDQWDGKVYNSRKSSPEVNSDPCNYASAPAKRVARGGSHAQTRFAQITSFRFSPFPKRDLIGGRLVRMD
jgi:formylglycine-generating enzyme